MAVAFDVKVTAHFEEDLGIACHYYLEKVDPKSASRFLDEYDLTVSRLQAMPTAAVKMGEMGLHWCPIGSFAAVFSVDSDAGEVMLDRLFYQSSDWKRRILDGKLTAEL